MNRTVKCNLWILTISLFAAILLNTTPSPAQTSADAPVDLKPSELHARLAKDKSEGLARARAMSAAASKAVGEFSVYDVKLYDINIRVDDTSETLHGFVGFYLEAVEENVTQVSVDLISVLVVDSVVGPAGPLSFSRAVNVVTIDLDQPYNAGESIQFEFWYHGAPPGGGLKAFSFDINDWGETSISSLSEPYFSRTWWPCKDRMTDKADSLFIHIEADTSLYVSSNGTLDSITAGGASNSHVFHYTQHYPIATYLFAVAIAPFHVWQQDYVYNAGSDTMSVIHHPYQATYSTSLGSWGQIPEMIDALSNWFGPYPFLDDKYGHSNFEWGGGMEHQTNTSMGPSWFGFYTPTIVHELAHQWCGDLITCASWRDIWLNEGFASYGEALWFLETNGWSSYHAWMDGMEYFGSGLIYVLDTGSVGRIFHSGLSYDKGAWVVHMLRGVVGEAAFATGLTDYLNSEFRWKAATTQDFENVWEASTGMELDWFFDEWIFDEGFPQYNYYYMYEPSDTGGFDIYLVLNQHQTLGPSVFHMPIDAYLRYNAAPGDTVTLQVDNRNMLYKFHSSTSLLSVDLDPANWVLDQQAENAWEMFIVSYPEEVGDGQRLTEYTDTVEFRGGTGPYTVTVPGGALPPGLSIDNNAIITGLPSDTGTYTFQVWIADNGGTGYVDQKWFSVRIAPSPSCCEGMVGDANGIGGDIPSVSDIGAIVDFLFITGTELGCLREADVNGSGGLNPEPDAISVSDIGGIVDFLFITGTPLRSCP